MEYLNFTCQGESHKADNKVCQDFSLTSSDRNATVAIVCDGHGGNRYFRSDIGAKYAAEITEESVRVFVKNIDSDVFKGKPYTSVGPVRDLPEDYKETEIDKLFRQLFSSIIFKWNQKVFEHAGSTPISEWETEHVEQKYLDDFVQQKSLEKTYGCTLMAFIRAKHYWFAFHLGDGKCIALQDNPIWSEPIPWDERCFLNKTTSLCDPDAINEFRYCYQGDGSYPAAIFLGSDGIDDSFGETTNLVNFYIQLAKEIILQSKEKAEASLQDTLPQLSKIGSRDDMSVACVYDKGDLEALYKKLVQWQVANVWFAVEETNVRIDNLKNKRNVLQGMLVSSDKTKIELKYATNDLDRAFVQKRNLVKKLNILLQERDGEDFVPYSDETGVDNIIESPTAEVISQETEKIDEEVNGVTPCTEEQNK